MTTKTKKNILKWSSHAVGLVPGLAIIRTNIGVLPTFSKNVLGGVIEAVCSLIILLIWLNRESLKKLSFKFYTKQSIVCIILFISLLLSYTEIYRKCNVPQGRRVDEIIQPLWLSSELKDFLKKNNMDSIEDYAVARGAYNADRKIQQLSYFSYLITEIIVYVNFVLMFVFLTLTFSFSWIKFENDELPE